MKCCDYGHKTILWPSVHVISVGGSIGKISVEVFELIKERKD